MNGKRKVLCILTCLIIGLFFMGPYPFAGKADAETQRIAFCHDVVAGNSEIYVMDADGSNQTRLTYSLRNDYTPDWSPDGSKIVFCSYRNNNWDVYVMNPDGSNQRQLFELGGSINGQVQLDVANSFGWVAESIDWAP